jgi:RHS repeat-associated protein
MQLVGRSFTAGNNYRYGFNGKEKDDDIAGESVNLNYDARIYDTRIAKWFSIDPLQSKYPGESPYIFTSDNPISFADLDGRDKIWYFYVITNDGTTIQMGTDRIKNNDVTLHMDETMHGPDFYATDVKQTVTLDMRTNTRTVSKVESDFTSRRPFSEGLGMQADAISDELIGHEPVNIPGGFVLSSEFTKSMGDKYLHSTKGADNLNIDGILFLATAGYCEAGIESLPNASEYASVGTELFKAYNEYKENNKVEAVSKATNSTPAKTPVNSPNNTKTSTVKNSPKPNSPTKPQKSTIVFQRADNFAGEKKGSLQNHAYWCDTTIQFKPHKNPSVPDTFVIKKNQHLKPPKH